MTSQYMSTQDFNEIMNSNGWHMSQAVKVYLVKASHCFKRYQLMTKAAKAHPKNKVLQAEYRHLDELRASYVWDALDTAEIEYLQQWRFLEDKGDFIQAMMLKYHGDLTKCTNEEKAKADYIEALESAKQQEIRNGVR
ncbi:hypothetical protein [Levilactobacillus brevis]|uniref:hypothetical protein n=2 Tax=Levilactobacillus brevis TaxID=1580 RepID=UPI00063AD5D8|nr:hypothetical protein [Levilactobacillus brevis]KLE30787.1 hypothetical protein AAX72_02065 [Levilactobacillus brevis]MCT3569110.1 hypothetical protein [Levilactobacillus brevis]MCT3578685.1 hypothetical protein [Levilactobacillus brevis]MDM7552570.1 hypothetical protein [Levilactobacillus brevis]MDM7649317.1 hypothetical protein [Levilactobacillus brevis]